VYYVFRKDFAFQLIFYLDYIVIDILDEYFDYPGLIMA